MSVPKPNPPSLVYVGPEVDRDLYRRLRKKISLVEKIELLGNNPDHETYHKKLIALAELHGVEVE